MERLKTITIIFLLAIGLLVPAALAKSPSVLLREGLYAEETEGDLDAAIKVYEQIIKDSSAQRPYVAQAMYRLGLCYLKKQNEQKARIIFEQLTTQFPDQSAVVNKVEPLLDKMGGPDPAALMPPDTKVYIEFGNPGRQVETILKMLKGTPFENPLAVIGGGGKSRKSPGKKSPGDIMAALLNPSMMAEFKKIRGMAVGITEISNNPPSISVLYPGKSDALRGVILAALSIVGTPHEPVEGMQTIVIEGTAGVAHDDSVIIIAQPLEQLTWCVKQYKGITSEPTLASENKVFARISKEDRRANAMTVWMDVAGTYSAVSDVMIKKGYSGAYWDILRKLRVADGLADFKNMEDIITSLLIEETGIAMDANINFKDDHKCLLYNMIRTPNLSRSGFEGVPSEAIVVASLALGESASSSVETAQKAVKKLTGLSIGREIFANIEQVNIFAAPPRATTGESDTIEHIVSCFGVAVTSRNPQHTYQLLTQILATADLLTTPPVSEQSAQRSSPAADKYLLPLGGGQKVYCYVGQRNKTTVLTFSPEVVETSLSAVSSGKSALAAGPLQEPLRRMPSDTSKMALINVGGAIRVADAYITLAYDNPLNPAHNTLAQLAQACDNTSVQLRTGESVDNFNLRISVEQLPPLDSVLPLLMQLSQADLTAKAKATKPMPLNGAVFGLTPEPQLKWKPGVNAKSHKVYFGTKADELSLLAELETPSDAELPQLKEGATYYWRVDEVWADSSVVTGDIWSFTIGELVGWWKLDEASGGTASDSSGNGNVGMLQGNPVWQPLGGVLNGALEFDNDDYVSISNESNFDITREITVAAWVNIASVPTRWTAIVTKGDSAWRLSTEQDDRRFHFAVGDRLSGKTRVNANQWHHVAGVYDGSQMRIYVDGELDASTPWNRGIESNDYPVYIGENSEATGRYWNGLIDDVRIYDYALSQEEIKALCNVKATEPEPVDRAVVGPDTKVELSWTPGIDAVSHKVLFGTEPDEPALLAEVTSPTYARLQALEKDTKYYWRVDEVQANGTVVSGDIWRFTTSGRLLGWWKFDESEGNKAADSSGFGNDGTLVGEPKWQPGRVGGALMFDGDGDHVLVPNGGEHLNGLDALTVCLWVKSNVTKTDKGFIIFEDPDTHDNRDMRYDAAGVYGGGTNLIKCGVTSDADEGPAGWPGRQQIESSSNIQTSDWQHIAMTWSSGNRVALYINGKSDTPTSVEPARVGTLIGYTKLIIGKGGKDVETNESWNGLIDDVRIYDYALSENEIRTLSNKGKQK